MPKTLKLVHAINSMLKVINYGSMLHPFNPLQVSDDNYEEVSDSYGSESLTETSSDEYTPFAKTHKRKSGKKRRRQGVSD